MCVLYVDFTKTIAAFAMSWYADLMVCWMGRNDVGALLRWCILDIEKRCHVTSQKRQWFF